MYGNSRSRPGIGTFVTQNDPMCPVWGISTNSSQSAPYRGSDPLGGTSTAPSTGEIVPSILLFANSRK